jgi:hypothetical protein
LARRTYSSPLILAVWAYVFVGREALELSWTTPPARGYNRRGVEEDFELPADQHLTIAVYGAGPPPVACIEPIAVGDALPEMPIFLKTEFYVPAPLEENYRTTWDDFFPAPMKRLLGSESGELTTCGGNPSKASARLGTGCHSPQGILSNICSPSPTRNKTPVTLP